MAATQKIQEKKQKNILPPKNQKEEKKLQNKFTFPNM
jgi:hypothetical protein